MSVLSAIKGRIVSRHYKWEEWFIERLSVVPDGHLSTIRSAIPPASAGAVVLDVGGGARMRWSRLFDGLGYRHIVLDIEEPKPGAVDYLRGSADTLPIRDHSIDLVISFEVLEHCREPQQVLNEIARVLKPGCPLILSTRQYWRTHGSPHDFFRYTRLGLEHLMSKAGLTVEGADPMGSTAAVIATAIEQSLPFLAKPLVKQATVYPMWEVAKWFDRRLFLRRANFLTDGDTSGWLIRARAPGGGAAS